LRHAPRPRVRLRFGAATLVAAAVPKDPAGEDDERLLRRVKVDVPPAVLEHIGESARHRWRVVIVDLELDQRPVRRILAASCCGESRSAPPRLICRTVNGMRSRAAPRRMLSPMIVPLAIEVVSLKAVLAVRPRHGRVAPEDEVVDLIARPDADLVAVGVDRDGRCP
jgi:hypothetical protein